jgi:hypothetical protein
VGGGIGEYGLSGREGWKRDYNNGPFRLGIWECGQFDCEGGIGDSIPVLVEGGIVENGFSGWKCRTRDYN